jgi:phage baseplate assembly protein W
MAIKIKTLKTLSDTFVEKQYVYKDLHLDMRINNYSPPGHNTATNGKDIKVSLNERAIVNSLLNLFNTRPGQRFLFPEYGLDILRFVFTQATERNGEIVGDAIYECIRKFEPRVRVDRIDVGVEPDLNQFMFDILYDIPVLSSTTTSSFLLDLKEKTFISLTTDKN